MGVRTLWMPIPKFAWIPFWWTLSQQHAYAFFYPPILKTKKILLFRLVPEKKSFVNIPLFWQSRRSWQAWRAVFEAQFLGLDISLSSCWDNFLPWLKPKQSSKRCSHRHFSKYLPNNFRTPSNHYKNYAKICFAA